MGGGHLFLAACLIAICLPILSVQLPRTSLYARLRSKTCAETRPTRLAPSTAQVSSPNAQPESEPLRRHTRLKTTTSSYDGGYSSEDSQISSPVVGSPLKKPWNPPFPKREVGKGKEPLKRWTVSPPTPLKKTGRQMEEKGIAVRLFPPDVDGDGGADDTNTHVPQSQQRSAAEETELVDPTQARSASRDQLRPAKRPRWSIMSIVWPMVAVLAILLFVLAYAILIAHCLAWFLVYKTEARLGEARRGIVQGGEMRLCLCAT